MDPNIHFELPGLPQDRGHTEDNAAYLRRLKAQQTGDAQPRAEADGKIPAATGSPDGKERRRSPRFQCSGSVEFKAEGSDIRMWGTVTDISLHGCYVEMSTTFPVNTKASLVLESAGVRLHAQATVRTSYPFLGMGMCFREIEPGQQAQLKEILAALAEQKGFRTDVPLEQADLQELLASVDPRACIDEIAEFFKKSAALSRDEFYEIAKRVRRS